MGPEGEGGSGEAGRPGRGPSPIGETEYAGPVTVSTLRFGGHAIRLVRPADPDRLLDDPGVLDWNRRDDYMPYWAYLWPGAYLLAEAVAAEGSPWLWGGPTAEALEIGCGLGLAGLVAAGAGAAGPVHRLRLEAAGFRGPLRWRERIRAIAVPDAAAGLARPPR